MTAEPLETLILDRFETPIGTAMAVVDGAGVLRALDWTDHEPRMRRLLARRYPGVWPQEGRSAPVRAAFDAYFAGEMRALEGLGVEPKGTAFQRKVWDALLSIAPGETLSYAGLASRIGAPTAMRAVGLANGSNPIALAIPCHRVIGANGTLTGYGGGLHRKRWLLTHEGAAFREAA